MTERPILMSAPMVRASLDDTKTQTRRTVKFKPHHQIEERDDGTPWPWMYDGDRDVDCWLACPYGQPGDRLWVRETYFAWGRWETRFSAKKGRDEWHFIDMTQECGHQYSYPADGRFIAPHRRTGGVNPTFWKRPAIFMPRAACRLVLEVTGVRVERLRDISEEDAIAEGIEPMPGHTGWWRTYAANCVAHRDTAAELGHRLASASYASLWESINGPESWAANPWVWVVEFSRVDPLKGKP